MRPASICFDIYRLSDSRTALGFMAAASRMWIVALSLLSVMGCAAPHRAVDQKVVSEGYLIPSGDPGIQLYIRNKHILGMRHFSAERTVIYVNGATQASEATFDLELDGYSWMDYLARHGYDVYFVDLRGYGSSSRPDEMHQAAADNPPVVRTGTAVKDLGTAIEHVLVRRRLQRLDLIGWSWGATIAGAYTAGHNDKISRLVLYAPQWVRNDAASGGAAPLGAYQAWTVAQGRDRLQAGAPLAQRDQIFPPEWFNKWSAAELATDAEGAAMNPPVVRTPNGIFQDNREYWFAGKALWDPARILVPTLVARGEWDEVTVLGDTLGVFAALSNARSKRLVVIGSGSHMVFIEKNRAQLFQEVQMFLDEGAQ
jgi:pimeloyl-ACP methyl ester carboxylesterase